MFIFILDRNRSIVIEHVIEVTEVIAKTIQAK